MKNIQLVVSSDGGNLKLAETFKKEIMALGANAVINDLTKLDLPLFISGSKLNEADSAKVCKLINEFEGSDGFVFIAPEYNGGLPPVLNNFISWLSICSNDWRSAFNAKPAAIATFSGGLGASLVSVLRLQLAYIGLNVIGRHISASEGRDAKTESIREVISQLIK